jgi:anti-anti-sigma factor
MQQPQSHYVMRQDTEQGVLVLTFTASLLNADAVEEALAAVTSAGCRKVVLNCQAVRSLVSGSLCPEGEPFKPLLTLRRQLKEAGGRLVLCNLAPAVEEVFHITRLDEHFELWADVAAAVDSLKE